MKILQAISIDLPYRTPNGDSTKLMNLLSQLLEVEINYTIEHKKANNKPHIHGYCTVHPSTLEKNMQQYFGGLSFKIQPCYDLKGWQEYITKECDLQTAQPINPIEPIEPIKPIKPIQPMRKNLKPSMSEYSKLLNAYPRTSEIQEKMIKMMKEIKKEQLMKLPLYDEVIKQTKEFAKKVDEENRSNKDLKRFIEHGVNYTKL